MDRKLKQDEYKTKRQFEKEGYQIVKIYDNELIEDKYCSDTDYKLEQEVTIAYHGARDLNDVKEDLRASLAKLFIFT